MVIYVLCCVCVCRCVRRRSCWQRGTSWRLAWASCGRTSPACLRRCAGTSSWAPSRSSLYITTAPRRGPQTLPPPTSPSLPPAPRPPALTWPFARDRPHRNPCSAARPARRRAGATPPWGMVRCETRTTETPACSHSRDYPLKNPTRQWQ